MIHNKILLNTGLYTILFLVLIYMLKKDNIIWKKIDFLGIRITKIIVDCMKISRRQNKKIICKIVYTSEIFLISLMFLTVIRIFFVGNFIVPTSSMLPTIKERDRFFANMMIYKFRKPKVEEIIIFIDPVTNKTLYTKRIVGLPGDIIEVKGNNWIVPKIDDRIKFIPGYDYRNLIKIANLDEKSYKKYLLNNLHQVDKILPNLKFTVNDKETGKILELLRNEDILNEILKGQIVELISKENYYFVLGDNLNESYDSREWGFVNEKNIKGKVAIRFFPINRIGSIK